MHTLSSEHSGNMASYISSSATKLRRHTYTKQAERPRTQMTKKNDVKNVRTFSNMKWRLVNESRDRSFFMRNMHLRI